MVIHRSIHIKIKFQCKLLRNKLVVRNSQNYGI
jgi:hypothetical protein